MSDLDKKNINYGALNRFYQDLKSHDLSNIPNYTAGSNIQISNGVISATDTKYTAGNGISIDSSNAISCDYSLPTASNSTLGGVKVGTGLNISNDGVLSSTVGQSFRVSSDAMYSLETSHILGDISSTNSPWHELGVYEWTTNANNYITQLTKVSGELPESSYANGLYIRSADNKISKIMRIEKVEGNIIYLSERVYSQQSTGSTQLEHNQFNCYAYRNSIVLGKGCETRNYNEVALCNYNMSHCGNTYDYPNNTLLSIGDSDGGHYTYGIVRNNAVEIMQNADMYVKGIGGYDGKHIKSETGYESTKTLQDVIGDKADKYIDESLITGATLTVDGSQPSIVASGSTTIVWDDLAASIPSGKTVEVSVVLINTGNSALTPTMSGNVQMMGDGNLTIQPLELGLYKAKYISALNKWLIEAIYQEVSGIQE